jgi:leucyl-tRNA synthetase
MRDWSVSRQRYWGAPIPIVYCDECGPQLVADADLPVVLPELKDFSPSGDGRSALARAAEWVKVQCPKCGGAGERETDTLDTYICSSWYMLRYLDPHNDKQPFDTLRANRWMPIDFYNGADHATAHMLYARFVTRFFHKKGLVESPEPFKKFLFNGKVTASDGQMFSKSKGNGVDPLEVIGQYGSDALRTYLMFAAPLELWVRWDPQGVPGAYRFLNRIWVLIHEFVKASQVSARSASILRLAHKTIKKVTEDLENQKYNTAIASMMEMVNELNLQKIKVDFVYTSDWKFALESLVQLVAPFAPHMADELWEVLGYTESLQKDHWPKWDESLIRDEEVTFVVQVNGKVRGKLQLAAGSSEKAVLEEALKDEKIKNALEGKQIRKQIFIRDRLLNLVV